MSEADAPIESNAEDAAVSQQSSPRRRSRRGGRARESAPATLRQAPFAPPQRRFAPTEIVSPDQLEQIHDASLQVLRDTGLDVLEPQAREIFAAAGCAVSEERVRFDPEHTQDRYRDAFYMPLVSDWRNFESWEEAGSPTAEDHAVHVLERALSECAPPAIDEAVRAELREFVDRRVRAGGVATDY